MSLCGAWEGIYVFCFFATKKKSVLGRKVSFMGWGCSKGGMDRKRGMSFFFLPHIALFPFSHHSITVSGGTNLKSQILKNLVFLFFSGA